MLPPALLTAGVGGVVVAYRLLRHYDPGVSSAAKQANAGDLVGAIAELERPIESKALSAAKARAMRCLLTLNEDWRETRRMFDEAGTAGCLPTS
jgi:hypothetical protein